MQGAASAYNITHEDRYVPKQKRRSRQLLVFGDTSVHIG